MPDIDYQQIRSAGFMAHHNYILSKDENDHTYTDKDDEIWWIVQEAVKHVMPKSEGKPVAVVVHNDGAMYVKITNYKPLKHGSELFTTPQTSTDVSELVQALSDHRDYICDVVGVAINIAGSKNNAAEFDYDHIGYMNRLDALIAKHTVK